MYLHIGNNNIILEQDIIGIFNIDSLKQDKNYEKIINKLKNENKLIKISDSNFEEKTLILTQNDNCVKGYISNISTLTLANRK